MEKALLYLMKIEEKSLIFLTFLKHFHHLSVNHLKQSALKSK
ncbi:hypothetical protein HOLDEFILI_00821 [Holdemania filiformis DSM 12042]|uniref:Uncharacterized protein n=1 Tax=Holdemania filiformis DSM 12042 TaxID=545696 RepID=B9Y4U0_9FIRM|nr:hypothetical protein HOLDEFILI_00821 [Holdemania filiformis DSM 12042]